MAQPFAGDRRKEVSVHPDPTLRKLAFNAFGTRCEVQYVSTGSQESDGKFEAAAQSWALAFQAKYSRFVPESLVSRINTAAGVDWVAVDADMETMLDLCEALFQMTRGLLDPTSLPLMRLWDWKRRSGGPEDRKPGGPGDQRHGGSEVLALPSDGDIAAVQKLIGWRKVKREKGRVFLPEKGMALDFGGFGKEYAVDRVAQIAVDHGVRGALVDFGHDIKAVGKPPGRPAWHIGIEDPERPGAYGLSIGAVDKGVASSGDYIRCFVHEGRRYGHILDPRTGRPVSNGCSQATVIAPTCLHAGVLSTTAFILGIPGGIELIQSFPGAEGLIVRGKEKATTRGFFNYVAS